jgi:hypothetical protein
MDKGTARNSPGTFEYNHARGRLLEPTFAQPPVSPPERNLLVAWQAVRLDVRRFQHRSSCIIESKQSP